MIARLVGALGERGGSLGIGWSDRGANAAAHVS